jgi:membrane protease YdiL (CAAX protease family)
MRKIYLALECAAIFYIIPPALYFIRHAIAFKILAIIIITGLLAWLYLRKEGESPGSILAVPKDIGCQIIHILKVFLPAATIMTMAAWYYIPLYFLVFPKNHPVIWILVMVLYPLVAAVPQELFFRGLFFRRYRPLFTDQKLLLAANALSFGLAHVFYANWMAPVLSFFGGLLFGYRYLQSGSLLVTAIEHGLWGDLLFTIGYGWYFYSGSIQ